MVTKLVLAGSACYPRIGIYKYSWIRILEIWCDKKIGQNWLKKGFICQKKLLQTKVLIKFFGSFKKKNNICIQYTVQCTYIIHILHFERLDPDPHYKGHLSATQVLLFLSFFLVLYIILHFLLSVCLYKGPISLFLPLSVAFNVFRSSYLNIFLSEFFCFLSPYTPSLMYIRAI